MEFLAGRFHDTYFWVLLSFVVFGLLVFWKGRGPILGALDARAMRIKADLDEATRLKSEAYDLLAESERKHRDALHMAQKIIDAARDSADRMHRETERKLGETLRRREAKLIERIARAETEAIRELRVEAADLASRAAEQLMRESLEKSGGRLVDDSIREMPERLDQGRVS